MKTPFHILLRDIRQRSNYPRLGDFSEKVGLTESGYQKMETGERMPSPETLQYILVGSQIGPKEQEELRCAWETEIAKRAGIRIGARLHNTKAIADKIVAEVQLMLRQCKVHQCVPAKHMQVFRNRLEMMLRAAED